MAERVVNGLRVVDTALPGVQIVEPRVFGDARGYFLEIWNAANWGAAGLPGATVQDNLSSSTRGVLRGLHYQEPFAQCKIVSVIEGEIFDVAVDVRVGSPTFGRWVGATLSSDNHRSIVVPEGFAHGFMVTGARAVVLYKCTEIYHPETEGGVAWNDPDIAIAWPLAGAAPVLSDKDQRYPRLREADVARLPRYAP